MSSDVMERENARWAAMLGNDFEALDELVHPKLVYTHSNARVDTKDSWIASMTSGTVDYRAVDRSDVQLTEQGDVAVITGAATFTVHAMNQDITITSRFSSVWVNDDGWKFFAWQNTPFPT